MKLQVILTCEHASNNVPEKYAKFFDSAANDLNSHKGWDPGAYEIMQDLAESMSFSCYFYPFTRLLIEPNRSLGHPQLFSVYSSKIPQLELIENYYKPYRVEVEHRIKTLIAAGDRVLHLSIHSFTPVFDGVIRQTDVGILFDPDRLSESDFCKILSTSFKENQKTILVHDNKPYKGTDDGFTTYLRTIFNDSEYAGIELEVNQRFISDGFESIKKVIRDSISGAIDAYEN